MSANLQYPPDIEKAGPAYWMTLHSAAASMPEFPTQGDKIRFRTLLRTIVNMLPDGNCQCKSHAKMHLMEKPPKLGTRADTIDWVCDFHNSVRIRQGKPTQSCQILHGSQKACVNCSPQLPEDPAVAVETVPEPAEPQPTPEVAEATMTDISGSYRDFRKASKKHFLELCKKNRVKPPDEILFQPCPFPHENTSCTRIMKDGNGSVIRSIVFLNPTQYGLRTIEHEFQHYKKALNKDPDAENELLVDNDAMEHIQNHFPYDKEDHPPIINGEILIADQRNKSLKYVEMHDRMDSSKKVMEFHQDGEPDDGFLRNFDMLYKPLEGAFGLSARDLNDAHTPEVFGNLIVTLTEYGMSPLGSLITSTLSSLALFGANAFMKNNLGRSDKKLMQEIGAHLLWNGMRYMNPKLGSQAAAGASAAGAAVASGDFMAALGTLIAIGNQYQPGPANAGRAKKGFDLGELIGMPSPDAQHAYQTLEGRPGPDDIFTEEIIPPRNMAVQPGDNGATQPSGDGFIGVAM